MATLELRFGGRWSVATTWLLILRFKAGGANRWIYSTNLSFCGYWRKLRVREIQLSFNDQ
jgi:hypothetical protein